MLFALICHDKPAHLQLRLDTRPEHVAYLNGLNEQGVLKLAGPFLDENGNPNGSLLIVEAESEGDVRSMAAADPYAIAGLFASTEVRRWNWTFNKPEEA